MESIFGLTRNTSKSLLYDPNVPIHNIQGLCQEHGCICTPKEDGIMVVDSPVGSMEYMRRQTLSLVQLQKLQKSF
jgi:light-regulated signal transduction histidine kinase (bacteriophytochrome)